MPKPKGWVTPDAVKEKISLANKGKVLSPETRVLIGNARRGVIASSETREKIRKSKLGHTYNLGKHHTKETRLKISNAKTGTHRSIAERMAISETLKKMYMGGNLVPWSKGLSKSTNPSLKKLSEQYKGKRTGNMNPSKRPDVRKKISISNFGKHRTELQKQAISQACKARYLDPIHKNARIKASRQGMHFRPNKAEKILGNIIDDLYPRCYEYTGDGKIVIDEMIPDFMNTNGRKQVIEHFGDYWHKGENPQNRIDRYAAFGFDCLVIWESELKDLDMVRDKIRRFCENGDKRQ